VRKLFSSNALLGFDRFDATGYLNNMNNAANKMSDQEQIQCELARLGLRSAKPTEAGENVHVRVWVDGSWQSRTVWARGSAMPRITRRRSNVSSLPAAAALWFKR